MSYQNQPTSTPLPSQQKAKNTLSKPRFARVRGWLRSRTGRIVIPLIALLVGVALGSEAIILYGLTGEGQKTIVTSSLKGNIVVEVDKAFLTQIVTNNLHNSGLPGQIENVTLDLSQADQITVNGDDVFNVLGIGVAKHFTFVAQPNVSSCTLKIHIVHADFSNIPVTRFAQSFESQINQQLQQKPEGLPSGFQYCTTEVRTEPAGIFVTYEAIPV